MQAGSMEQDAFEVYPDKPNPMRSSKQPLAQQVRDFVICACD